MRWLLYSCSVTESLSCSESNCSEANSSTQIGSYLRLTFSAPVILAGVCWSIEPRSILTSFG